jgi:hypothetical protein
MVVFNESIPSPRLISFIGGHSGEWLITSQTALRGDPIENVSRVAVFSGVPGSAPGARWLFQGVATHDRYTSRSEKTALLALQAPIGRPQATRAGLTMLRKNARWWGLAQDERRAILEEQSHHIAIGLRYLPKIARSLLHCRDFITAAPFDFLGFLDFEPDDESAYDEMLGLLRATPEWTFMEREIDIRMTRDEPIASDVREPRQGLARTP